MLWAERRRTGNVALVVTLAAILVNGDILSAIRILLTRGIIVPQPNFLSRLMTLTLTRPAPVVLLAMAIFFLWTYLRSHETAPIPALPITSADNPSQSG